MTIRPRIQRAFLAWLSDAASRLRRPVRVIRRTDAVLTFSAGVDGLVGALRRNGLSVFAEHAGVCWDIVFDEDVYVEGRGGQWRCSGCLRSGVDRSFGSREALWHDHLFQPLEAWVNGRLAGAATLALFATESGDGTWAELLAADVAAASLPYARLLIPLSPVA